MKTRYSWIVVLLACLQLQACNASGDNQTGHLRGRGIMRVDAGDLAAVMEGASTISFHHQARIVRPGDGRSVKQLRATTDSATASIFREHGYLIVPRGQADRVVAYAIGASGELEDEELSAVFGISPGIDQEGEVKRGGLVLVILHGHTGKVLWRGGASAEIEEPDSLPAGVEAERIRSALDRILAELPTRP